MENFIISLKALSPNIIKMASKRIPDCYSCLCIIVNKHCCQSNLESKGFIYFILQLIVNHEEKSGQELRILSRSHRGIPVTGLPLTACSPCFPIQLRTICPVVALPSVGWALPLQSLIHKMHQRCVYKPTL